MRSLFKNVRLVVYYFIMLFHCAFASSVPTYEMDGSMSVMNSYSFTECRPNSSVSGVQTILDMKYVKCMLAKDFI